MTMTTPNYEPSEQVRESLRAAGVEELTYTKEAIVLAGAIRADLEKIPTRKRDAYLASVTMLAATHSLSELKDRFDVVNAELKSRIS